MKLKKKKNEEVLFLNYDRDFRETGELNDRPRGIKVAQQPNCRLYQEEIQSYIKAELPQSPGKTCELFISIITRAE